MLVSELAGRTPYRVCAERRGRAAAPSVAEMPVQAASNLRGRRRSSVPLLPFAGAPFPASSSRATSVGPAAGHCEGRPSRQPARTRGARSVLAAVAEPVSPGGAREPPHEMSQVISQETATTPDAPSRSVRNRVEGRRSSRSVARSRSPALPAAEKLGGSTGRRVSRPSRRSACTRPRTATPL